MVFNVCCPLTLGIRRDVEDKMAEKPYDPDVYRRFADNLKAALRGPNIEHISMSRLRRKALRTARITSNGSALWYSKISSRIAAKTVYLGSGPETVLPRATPEQLSLVEKAPE